jgi:hypothetical protein
LRAEWPDLLTTPPVHNLHVSPIGVVSKSDGGWRMITHLSYPPSICINNHIDPVYTSVNYTSFDTVIQTISHLGKGALIAKADIKSAFRLIRVHPADFELLGLNMNGKFYVDKCLPFGCSISCKIFEICSTFLEWLVRKKSEVETVHHYLDDFIFAGSSYSNHCHVLVHTFQSLCVEMGIPLIRQICPTYHLFDISLVGD